MSTTANIEFMNVLNPFSAGISHDGYSEAVLRVLAAFYESPEEGRTFARFKELYLSQYENAGSRSLVQVHDEKYITAHADWEYTISNTGELQCSCNESWHLVDNNSAQCSPYETLKVTLEEYCDEVRENIRSSIERLNVVGIVVKI